MISLLPFPKVYGDAPLVITRAKNYSASNMPEFLAAVGFSEDEVARYRSNKGAAGDVESSGATRADDLYQCRRSADGR